MVPGLATDMLAFGVSWLSEKERAGRLRGDGRCDYQGGREMEMSEGRLVAVGVRAAQAGRTEEGLPYPRMDGNKNGLRLHTAFA